VEVNISGKYKPLNTICGKEATGKKVPPVTTSLVAPRLQLLESFDQAQWKRGTP